MTGGMGGLGEAIARALHDAGHKVLVTHARDEGSAREWLSAEKAKGYSFVSYDVNVADFKSCLRMAERIGTDGHRVDILVNNAGITRDASMKKMTLENFDAVISVHLRGTWLGVREASAVMREQKSGSIVNISSLSGKSGNPGQTNYSAAKAGIVGLTKAAAKEVAHHNVRVNAVQPGLIRTPMTAAMPPDVFAQREADVPMKRAGEPGEVAGAVVFLASSLSSYITGSVIEVGGGRYM